MIHKPNNLVSRGFTLVELLVVVGIISLLIGLMMPAIARARQAAYRVACMSNLSQIGIAMQAYQNDNEGMLPIVPTLPMGVVHL